ncbi:MAG TPA: amino acid adenylation domain-containing protein [Duganella sp.]|uniref:non-ribosomal peptide synthetase n=1 Tax=Duganella sp. TaxID=1904440 RepID=UPI002ED433E1
MNATQDEIRHWPLGPEQRMLPDDGATHFVTARADVRIEPLRLERALATVAERHQSLRFAYRALAGYRGLRQQEQDGASVKVTTADATSASATLAELLAVARKTVPDTGAGQTIVATIIHTGESSSAIALNVAALAADQASLPLLWRDLSLAYDGKLDEEEVFQYSQYVEWRRDLDDDSEAAQGRAYWDDYLKRHAGAVVPQLCYRGEPAVAGSDGDSVARAVIDADVLARIEQTASARGAGLETALQLAWWLLLARLQGSGHVLGGWLHDCRRDYEVMAGAVGVFDKVMPVAIESSPESGFGDLLAAFAETLEAHRGAQEYCATSAPAIGFVFMEPQDGASAWSADPLPGPGGAFELALRVVHGGQTSVALHATAARYAQQDVACLLQQYVALLDGLSRQPDMTLAEVSLPAGMVGDGAGAVDLGTVSVGERIAQLAASSPDAPAIIDNGVTLTYLELDRQAGRLARWMAEQGVGRGDLVALNLERSSHFVVGLLAAWRLGAGYLPLDPHWPSGRRDAILADARPALLLHASEAAMLTAAADWPRQFGLDGLRDTATSIADVAPQPRNDAADVAYVLYTSGSTGTPKGVIVEHGQLLNYVAGASRAMELAASRRWALTGTVAADLGNTALFGALYNGACLVVAGAADMQDAPSFARFLRTHAIDAVKMVPSHLEALLDGDDAVLPRLVVLGGEAAPAALIARMLRLEPACRIYNHYGPTETTVGVMIHAVDGAAPSAPVLPLSAVLPNCRIEVLDAQLRPVPAGSLGEIYIGGAQLARGYLNGAGGSAFIDDPRRPGQRLYRSGDLAWLLPNGAVLLAGRADHQVKIRGYRVEPAEIEAALLAAPGVRQGVVLAVPDEAGKTGLLAVAVLDDGAQDAEALIKGHLAARLPTHMLPARYVFVAALPRLANGKIDRAALAASAPLQRRAQLVAPRDALEFVLADCMAGLLGRQEIGVDEDFFDAGGHSLLVIKLTARIRKLLKVEIAPGLVFDHATVEALARLLRTTSADAAQLDKLAEAQRRLALLTPEQRAALLERSRQGKAA